MDKNLLPEYYCIHVRLWSNTYISTFLEGRTELAKPLSLKEKDYSLGLDSIFPHSRAYTDTREIKLPAMAAEPSCLWKLNCLAWELTEAHQQAGGKLQFSERKQAPPHIPPLSVQGLGQHTLLLLLCKKAWEDEHDPSSYEGSRIRQ